MAQSSRTTNLSAQRAYRVREFADLCGVTVKALRHYDRLGLLIPARAPSGHRIYSTRDGERLRRIVALKRVGVPLARVRDLLDADPAALAVALAANRQTLLTEQDRLVRAGRAIALVEESLRHAPGDEDGLSRLADVLDAQRDVARMRRYFSDDVWDAARMFYEDWPAEEWVALYREIAAAIPDGTGTTRAEDLLRRWHALGRSLWERHAPSDPPLSRKLNDGFARAWRDRENWPDTLKRRFADYRIHEIAGFLSRVSIAVLNRRGPSWFVEQQRASPHVA